MTDMRAIRTCGRSPQRARLTLGVACGAGDLILAGELPTSGRRTDWLRWRQTALQCSPRGRIQYQHCTAHKMSMRMYCVEVMTLERRHYI